MKRLSKLRHAPIASLYKTSALFLSVATRLYKGGQIGHFFSAKLPRWTTISLAKRTREKTHELDRGTPFFSRLLAFLSLNPAPLHQILGLHPRRLLVQVLLAFGNVLCTSGLLIFLVRAILVRREPLFF